MPSKKDIRPVLNLNFSGATEAFQNITLRPILKLQHSIIILMFKSWAVKHKIRLFSITVEGLKEILEKSLSKNNAIKNQLLGITIGHFTDEEYETYALNSSEYNKRIFTMIKQRLFDSFEEIKNITE
ncbi:glyoxalase [Tenacibaculum sp. 190524A05c]|uniref:glyoxalase n=1 Tax=Tenacibaculum platacis TaxID=3137852 RepID=UPI0031FAE0D7